MIDIRLEVEKLLKTIKGVKIAFYYPSNFNKLPVVSYYKLSNSEGLRFDLKESTQTTVFQVDVWSMNGIECGEIAIKVNEVMQKDMWYREFSQDLPKTKDGIYHKTIRFKKNIYL